MEVQAALIILQGAISIYKTVAPIVQQAIASGELTPEQEQSVIDAYNSIEKDFSLPAYQKQP